VLAEVKAATESYRAEMDTLAHFLDDCCEQAAGNRVGSAELFAAFQGWSKANGEYQRSNKWFSQRLEERGFEKKRSGAKGGREWYGWAVKVMPPHMTVGRPYAGGVSAN
jgi:putative DNA primase/helicase